MQWSSLLWQSPQWLWLLLALAIPLLIHLLRRSSPREITFAAMHWLRQKPQRSWNRLALRDRWLLLLRLLLLALLVLLLARPQLQRDTSAASGTLLVDPHIERAQLKAYLKANPDFTRALWLQPEPVPVSAARPAARDLWRSLSGLAAEGEFRHAYILLLSAKNPDGHNALKVSPHWQWHALESGAAEASNAGPQLALLGAGPPWLEPVLQQWKSGDLSDLELQKLGTGIAPDGTEVDWVIYDTAGELPRALYQFVADGGLLITDTRVRAAGSVQFTPLAGVEPLAAAAIGRGSWLRYRRDWHSAAFYQRADLPRRLWQQWSAQDWRLQHDNRGLWSIEAPPGIPVAESAVQYRAAENFDSWLLCVFTLLLTLERAVVLARTPAGGRARD